MSDIISGYVFVDAEKGVTANKLNSQISGAVIQTDFVTSKPSSSTLDPTDQLLEVKGAGTYARITGSQLISSVSAQVDATPQIYSVRLRSFNSLGNPNFEVCQRNCSSGVINPVAGTFIEDRWSVWRAGTHAGTWSRSASLGQIVVPGTSFVITITFMRFTLTTQQASLGATDFLSLNQNVEGPFLRELIGDVHSAQVLVASNVAGLKFGLDFRDPGNTRSLTKLCTIPSANTWTLIQMPNLPVFPPAGNFQLVPGQGGYQLAIALAAGSTYTAPANDTWQNGVFVGALGQDNFASKPVNSTFDIAFVQHEPGAQCTTLMDCPFTNNLDACLRYYAKSAPYATKPPPPASTYAGIASASSTAAFPRANLRWPKVMAKTPTVRVWALNQTLNSATNESGGTTIGATASDISEICMSSLSTPSGLTAGQNCIFHWDADTGW